MKRTRASTITRSGNQLLALLQCHQRGIPPGPLATFPKWKELGRSVKKGEKALILCMPITRKRTKKISADDGTEQDEEFAFTHFNYKPHWFALSQTEGADYQPAPAPEWAEQLALETLQNRARWIPYVTHHSLRHFFANMLKGQKLDIGEISRFLGHANPTVTRNIYLHWRDEALQGRAQEVQILRPRS